MLPHLLVADGDTLCQVTQGALQRLVELEAASLIGAGPHERTPDRRNRRSGYRPKQPHTRVGQLEVQIPTFRVGRFLVIDERGA